MSSSDVFTIGNTNIFDEDKAANNGPGIKKVRSVSRFQVAKVEFETEEVDPFGTSSTDPDEGDEHFEQDEGYDPEDTVDDLPLSKKDKKRRRVRTNSSSSNNNTHTYETKNLKTFGRNTLETLPHLDHYRNLLSATAALRKRPTLYELHTYVSKLLWVLLYSS